MVDATTTQCVLFPELFDRLLVARFDQEHGSSDGGAVLLKAADTGLRLTARLAACLPDDRQPGKVRHELLELLRQRVYAIACGYPDGNDAARLADDPVHKMLVERDPIDGDPLASQPTLSRFENAIRPRHLYLMGEALADVVIERQRRRRHARARRITLELDPTDDPTHGGQQLTFFNGHYDTWCYLPVAAFVRFNDEAEQHLVAAVLRPGNATAGLGALGILRRLLPRLYRAFPEAPVLVRLDGGFATPEILDYLDAQAVAYVVAMAKNSVLKRLAEPRMKKARFLSQDTEETEHLYGECRYAARSWPHRRRVIFKAEVVRHPGRDPKDNPRFVITNLSQNPQWVYERVYCQRGEIENRIKELHHGLEIDRTSCSRFWANQFRVLMTAAAYVLMQELRHQAAGTVCARAQVGTLRERLIKIGVRIEASVRRIVLHLPSSFPYLRTWRHVAHALGARAG
jgi:hypothetical protein